MLQTAARAETVGAPAVLIAAALLHDIGHMLHSDETATEPGIDFEHESTGAAWLSRGFGIEITAPIALHVEAKRFLCTTEPAYLTSLSKASQISLRAQGGIMAADEVAAFQREPAFQSAVTLRRCDDEGKNVGAATKSLAHYRRLLEDLALRFLKHT